MIPMTPKRETKKVNFTKRALKAAKPPASGTHPATYYDTRSRGLCLAVSPKGNKTFFLYRWIQGRPERIRIGPFPQITIEEARGQADGKNADIAKGLNPAAERKTQRDNYTLQELFDKYVTDHVEVHNRSARNAKWFFKAYLSPLSSRQLHEIQRNDVQILHRRIGSERGPYAANRGLQLLRTLFNWASARGYYGGPNPVLGLVFFREHKRARFLLAEELPRFWKAVLEEPNRDLRDFILMALLTGGRRGNVQAMRWTQINQKSATWTIPAVEAKAGEAIEVPLVPAAFEILKQRLANDGKSEWVFPGPGKTGHLMEPKGAWGRLRKRAGLIDLRFHDLRRSLGSWMLATGATLPVIGKTLGHTSLEATKIYARLELDPVRKAMEAATDAMLGQRHQAKQLGKGGMKRLPLRSL